MLIDTHCHLTFDDLHRRSDAVIAHAAAVDVTRLITVATTPADAREALRLMAAHDNVFLAAGVHPHEAGKVGPEELDALAALHRGEWELPVPPQRVVAVGETGLDFHYDFATPERQEDVFRFQLELACEVQRPIVIHARESELRVCEILAEYPMLRGRVVFHCFSAGPDVAERVLDLGCFISFTGVVTFRNADALRESARLVPDERIMVETDAPYLSPEPVRKLRPCEPAFVAHTARRLADIRNMDFDAFAALTTANAMRFFDLPEVPA